MKINSYHPAARDGAKNRATPEQLVIAILYICNKAGIFKDSQNL
jgi:hypothetical protein